MHRMHCGSNKVRRGSWPPQVSFVSRLLPPSDWAPWRGVARRRQSGLGREQRGLPRSGEHGERHRAGVHRQRAPAGAVIPMRLRSSAESWETMPYQPSQLEAWRAGPGGQAGGPAAGGRAGTVEWIDIGLRPWSRGLGLAVQPDGDLELLLFKLSAIYWEASKAVMP